MSQIGDSKETKYIARRLGVFVSIAAMISVAVMWTTIMITVEDLINPPSLQPEGITRIEKMTEECWDILAIRREQEGGTSALILTLTEVCDLDQLRYPRVLRELQYWFEREYQSETYFVREWVFKEGRKYVIRSITVCYGLEVLVEGIANANCPSGGRNDVVPQEVWRRWWVGDFNNWRSK